MSLGAGHRKPTSHIRDGCQGYDGRQAAEVDRVHRLLLSREDRRRPRRPGRCTRMCQDLLPPSILESTSSMSDTDIAVQDHEPQTRIVGEITNPFQRARSPHLNEGAVAIESERAIAEAQGKLILAKRFPRDEGMAFDRVMEAC